MTNTKKPTFKELCEVIDLIIAGTAPKGAHRLLYFQLSDALSYGASLEDVKLLCETAIKLAHSKGRIIPHTENRFWDFLSALPLVLPISSVLSNKSFKMNENETVPNEENAVIDELMKLADKILSTKKENTARYIARISAVIHLLSNLLLRYDVPKAKDIIIELIDSENTEIQFNALTALENHFINSDDELSEDLIEKLDDIAYDTTDRTTFVTCMEIQINAGIIDEMTALSSLDDWKERNYPWLYDNDEDMD